MGYYDDTLAHSFGPWKKHKYVRKVGDGPNAKYYYGNSKIGATYNMYRDMPGVDPAKAAKWTAEDAIDDAKFEAEYAVSNGLYKAGKYIGEKSGYQARQNMLEAERNHRSANNVRNDTYFKNAKTRGEKSWNSIVDQDVKNKRDTAHAAKQVYDKTPLGKIESTANRGREAIANLFKKKK